VWKPNRDVYVSWNTVGHCLSVVGGEEEWGGEEGRGNEAEGRKGKKEKDGRDVIIARLAAARVRP
jgi:hypothetical protein